MATEAEVSAVFAAAATSLSALDALLREANYNIERFRDKMGRTVFMSAILQQNMAVFKYCLGSHFTINPDDTDSRGMTALHLAAKVANLQMCNMLMQLGWDLSAADNYGATPLHVAARSGDNGVVRHFVRYGADMEARDAMGRTPPFHACLAGKANTLSDMIHRLHFSIEMRDILNSTLLHAAASAGHPQCIDVLMSYQGAFVSETNKDDFTALHIAAEKGNLECCRRLVAHGASVNAVSKVEHQTPLSCAITNYHEDVVNYLVMQGGMTPEDVKMVVSLIIQSNKKKYPKTAAAINPVPPHAKKMRRRSSAFSDSDGPGPAIRVNGNSRRF